MTDLITLILRCFLFNIRAEEGESLGGGGGRRKGVRGSMMGGKCEGECAWDKEKDIEGEADKGGGCGGGGGGGAAAMNE